MQTRRAPPELLRVRSSASGCCFKALNRRHGLGDVPILDCREDRQGAVFGGEPLRHRQAAPPEAELGVGGLQMDRRRVVDRAGDPAGVEMIAQRIALGAADDEEVVDVVAVGPRRGGGDHLAAGQPGAQGGGGVAAALVPVRQVAQLDLEDRRLQGVEAVGAGRQLVVMASPLAVGAEQAHLGVQRRIAGHQGAAVSPATEVLGRVEAEAAGVAERADRPAAVEGAVRLAGILDDGDAALASKRQQRVHLDRAAEEVDRDDAARLLAQRLLHRRGGEQCGLRVDVDDDRRCADGRDRLGRGDEAVGRDDDLVAGADPQRAQGDLERGGAGGDAGRVLRAAEGGEGILEALQFGAEGEGGVAGDPLDDLHQLREELRVGAVEADEGNLGALGRRQGQGVRCNCGAHGEAFLGLGGVGSDASLGKPRFVVRWSSRKSAAASWRERTPNLAKAEERWLLIVLSERNSCSAIWALVRPSETKVRTWRSRWEKAGRSTLARISRGTTAWPEPTALTVTARVDSKRGSKTIASAPASRARRTPVAVAVGETATIAGPGTSRRRRRSAVISRWRSTSQAMTMIVPASSASSPSSAGAPTTRG